MVCQLFLQQCCIATIPKHSGLNLTCFILMLTVSGSSATWLDSWLQFVQVAGWVLICSIFFGPVAIWYRWSTLCVPPWCPGEREVASWGVSSHVNHWSIRTQAQCVGTVQGCDHVMSIN